MNIEFDSFKINYFRSQTKLGLFSENIKLKILLKFKFRVVLRDCFLIVHHEIASSRTSRNDVNNLLFVIANGMKQSVYSVL